MSLVEDTYVFLTLTQYLYVLAHADRDFTNTVKEKHNSSAAPLSGDFIKKEIWT